MDYLYSACQKFLSTPSARRATPKHRLRPGASRNFYPRPPRGGRPMPSGPGSRRANFYPRPPRGGRPAVTMCVLSNRSFLSTPSARRATDRQVCSIAGSSYFYPRPPRGGRPTGLRISDALEIISIHALREEGDDIEPMVEAVPEDFYPRPPRGGRRHHGRASSGRRLHFYPRPPRGGRP